MATSNASVAAPNQVSTWFPLTGSERARFKDFLRRRLLWCDPMVTVFLYPDVRGYILLETLLQTGQSDSKLKASDASRVCPQAVQLLSLLIGISSSMTIFPIVRMLEHLLFNGVTSSWRLVVIFVCCFNCYCYFWSRILVSGISLVIPFLLLFVFCLLPWVHGKEVYLIFIQYKIGRK